MAHSKHQSVRVRHGNCCGYCGISETDAGGELTVDHYEPVSAGGDDSDENLVYACVRCNQYKGAFTPSETEQAQGLRLLHPLRDNIAEHLRENEATGRLEGLTPLGVFHIASLELNRDALIAHRLRRRVNLLQEARYARLLSENASLRERLTRYKFSRSRRGGADADDRRESAAVKRRDRNYRPGADTLRAAGSFGSAAFCCLGCGFCAANGTAAEPFLRREWKAEAQAGAEGAFAARFAFGTVCGARARCVIMSVWTLSGRWERWTSKRIWRGGPCTGGRQAARH